ncbi:TOMM precursor leader peptide-binding protein [Streptomyces sp. NPDC040724]|uniref:TOMM precursor leader peptide-binding protein n=1 Tax=unclassified Streptomyces TaxID=2593676 RepID=UPI00340D1DC0
MASAISLMRPQPGPVPLVGAGGFGARTVALLAQEFAGSVMLPADELQRAFREFEGPVVLAAWRPMPALFEQADAWAYRLGRAWLPVVMETSVVRVGPLVVPAGGPCFRCYRERRRQHDLQGVTTSALYEAYDADPECGPGGFLPHHARLAATVAARYVRAAAGEGSAAGPRPGAVSTLSLRQWGVDTSHVVPWHGCPRCSDAAVPADRAGETRLDRLRAALFPAPCPVGGGSR